MFVWRPTQFAILAFVALFVLQYSPPLILAIVLYILNCICDAGSTYLFGLFCGPQKFFECEQNARVLKFVAEYGLKAGIKKSLFDPVGHFLQAVVLPAIFGGLYAFIYYLAYKEFYFFAGYSLGLFVSALAGFYAATSNIFLTWKMLRGAFGD